MVDELLCVVDENDVPLEPMVRSKVIELGLWRRTAGGIVVDKFRRLVLCQQRSWSKDERPGLWVAAFGGKVGAGEQVVDTVVRELTEELGIVVGEEELFFLLKYKSLARRQFEYSFLVNVDSGSREVMARDGEAVSVRWVPVDEAIRNLEGGADWFAYGFEFDAMREIL